MPVITADPRSRAFEVMQSRHMVRLYNHNTGQFAHLSGEGVTKDVNFAWLGFIHQSQTLLDRHGGIGQHFNGFVTEYRDYFVGNKFVGTTQGEANAQR